MGIETERQARNVKRKRPVRILIFVNEAEKSIIDQKAAELRMNRSEYIRAVATGSLTMPEKENFAKILKEIGAIGSSLNQIAKQVKQEGGFTGIITFQKLLGEFEKWLYLKK